MEANKETGNNRISELVFLFNGVILGRASKIFDLDDEILGELCDFLEFCIDKKTVIDSSAPEKEGIITFTVNATYDKPFYCAAKISDKAISLSFNETKTEYYVSFRKNQVPEIDEMYYAIVDTSDLDRQDLLIARNFLTEHCYDWFLSLNINEFMNGIKSKFGWQPILANSFLIDTLRMIRKKRQQRFNSTYSEIAKEGRIQSKWVKEYQLFSFVRSFVFDAIYQYSPEWLKKQSYDIFIPSQKIAIEYQGIQHYQPIDIFGGKGSFEKTQERDKRKRILSKENGIILLEWKYTVPINIKNMFSFFSIHGIKYSKHPLHPNFPSSLSPGLIMAPVIETINIKSND